MDSPKRKFKKGDKVKATAYTKTFTGIVEGYVEVKQVSFVLLEDGGFWLEEELALIA